MDTTGILYATRGRGSECAVLIGVGHVCTEVALASGELNTWITCNTIILALPRDPGVDWSRALETRTKRLTEVGFSGLERWTRRRDHLADAATQFFGLDRSKGISRTIEPEDIDADQRDTTIRSLVGDLDMERQRTNRLGDECGALKSERDDLLRENATLRRKLERRR